jgi:hypothetical protein
MVRLSPNSEWNLSTSVCAREHGNSYPKTCGFTRHDAGLLAGGLGAEGVPALPVESIVRKRMNSFAVQCVSPLYPASFSVTASGSNRRPAARRFTAFPVPPRTSLRAAAQNAAQTSSRSPPKSRRLALGSRTLSLGFARCDPSKIGKFKNGDTKCTRTK